MNLRVITEKVIVVVVVVVVVVVDIVYVVAAADADLDQGMDPLRVKSSPPWWKNPNLG